MVNDSYLSGENTEITDGWWDKSRNRDPLTHGSLWSILICRKEYKITPCVTPLPLEALCSIETVTYYPDYTHIVDFKWLLNKTTENVSTRRKLEVQHFQTIT